MNRTRFAKAWKELEVNTAFYWDVLEQFPEHRLKEKPSADKWSILQVLEHLVGAEEMGMHYLKRKQYVPIKTKSNLPGSVRAMLLKIALLSPMKFKAPKEIEVYPTNTTKPEALLEHWKKLRNEYALYIEQMPVAVEDKPLFRHPRAGPLTLKQTLVFMADHLHHHKRQIKLILSKKAV